MTPEDATSDLTGTASQIIGSLVANRYHVEALLGRGGMGAVYLARLDEPVRHVALKVLLPSPGQEVIRARRFMRESRLASRLQHPLIVQVLDFGFVDARRSQRFLAMELVRGVPLTRLLDRPLLTPAMACGVMIQVLEALGYVHARGILHRDIKPDNILITRDGDGALRVKVADFGLAKQRDGRRLTDDGAIVGTLGYMAPEQADGGTLGGPEVDLYPVGVMLFELWMQRPLFEGTLLQVLLQKTTEDLELPPSGAPALEERHWRVLGKLLARQPKERFHMAADVVDALGPLSTTPSLDDASWNELVAGEVWSGLASLAAPGATPAGAAPRRSSDSLWGRAPDLDHLSAVASDVERGQGRLVVITGDAGIGKSALLEGFAVELQEAGRFLVVRATLNEGSELTPMRHAIERWLGVSSASRDTAMKAVDEFYGRYAPDGPDDREALLRFLRPRIADDEGHLPSPSELLALLRRWLRALASDRPVLLVLDDLQHGGDETLRFLDHLHFELAYEPFPLLVLAAATNEADHEGDASLRQALKQREQAGVLKTHQLSPLSERAMLELLQHRHGLSTRNAERVARYAEGNPLLAGLLVDKVSQPGAPGGSSDSSPLAQRLQALLQRQLDDSLAPRPDADYLREALVSLAVLGGRARVTWLERMLDWSDETFDERLDALVAAQLVKELHHADEAALAHPNLGEAVLASQSRRRLRKLHGSAAAALMADSAADAHAPRVAGHLHAAGRDGEAISWWRRAMQYEQSAGQAQAAANHGLEALALMAGTREGVDVAFALGVGRLLREVGAFDRAIEVLSPLGEGADADVALLAAEALVEIYQEKNDRDARVALFESMQTRLHEASPVGRRAFWRARAHWLNQREQLEEAITAGHHALDGAPPGREAHVAAIRLAWSYTLSFEHERAKEMADRAFEAAEGDPLLEAEASRVRCFIDFRAGRGEDNLERRQQQLETYRRAGLTAKVVRTMADMTAELHATGDHQACLKLADETFAIAERMDLRAEAMRARLAMLFSRACVAPTAELVTELEQELENPKPFIPLRKLVTLLLGLVHARRREFASALDRLEACEDFKTTVFPPIVASILQETETLFAGAHEGHDDLASRLRVQRRRLLEAELSRRQLMGQDDLVARCRERLVTLASVELR